MQQIDKQIDQTAKRFEEKTSKGLVDMKWYPNEVHNVEVQDFCRANNLIDEAIESGKCSPFSFNDSYNK